MSEIFEGGCRCGRVRYAVRLDRPNVYACHCRDCQTWSGSAFSLQLIVPEGDLELTAGEPDIYERASLDGVRTSRQRGCRACLTRVFNTNTGRPGLAVVRAGTLDRSDELNVVAHMWAKRKLAGVAIPDGVPAWAEGAPPGELLAALTGSPA